MNNIKISVSLAPATLRKLEHEAARRGRSVDQLIDEWIRHENRQEAAVMLGELVDP